MVPFRKEVIKRQGNFYVKILADSIVDFGADGRRRMSSFEAGYPRCIHPEVLTHRQKSINSPSSRAIPIETMIEMVLENPFIPDIFPKTHKRMQATEWFDVDSIEHKMLTHVWLSLRDTAVASARLLNSLGVTKQLANRVLEPFLMYKAIMSGTDWENMIALRAHPDAQHEFQILANLMLEALNESIPVELKPGEWHVPFGDKFDQKRLKDLFDKLKAEGKVQVSSVDELARMISVARCARISYNNPDGSDDYAKDIALYLQLLTSVHMSPFEHVAQAMTVEEYKAYTLTGPGFVLLGCLGNLRGFKQLRKTFPAGVEQRAEPRLLLK